MSQQLLNESLREAQTFRSLRRGNIELARGVTPKASGLKWARPTRTKIAVVAYGSFGASSTRDDSLPWVLNNL